MDPSNGTIKIGLEAAAMDVRNIGLTRAELVAWDEAMRGEENEGESEERPRLNGAAMQLILTFLGDRLGREDLTELATKLKMHVDDSVHAARDDEEHDALPKNAIEGGLRGEHLATDAKLRLADYRRNEAGERSLEAMFGADAARITSW
jgi:hypothetical protein